MGKLADKIENGLCQILKNELKGVGLDISLLESSDDILTIYFKTCMLFPKPQKYFVHIHNDFVCPDEYKNGYNLLLKKIKMGEKFSAHLSRNTKDTGKHDLMLYDWGIYHFHLGTTLDADGYIKRTKD